ncbi:MAG: T9SS type A sorting domain-containing protein [Flavobacteriales bacterium]|nr:T9SS type A sorting domain-containing protein [Flavobacteriales bacterium]
MRPTLLALIVPLLITRSNAQSIAWMRDAGSTPFSAHERGDAVDVDTDGNSYVLGHLSIDSQFSGLPVNAHQDGCVAKYDMAGAVQWVRTFGGPGFVDIQETAVKVSTADNAVYACGLMRTQFANPTVYFGTDSFTYNGNSLHAFLVKYDLNGNFQWMRHGGGAPYGARFNDLDIDDQGRIVAVGSADGTNVFDGQTIISNANKGVLARYLPDGTLTDLVQLADSANSQQATAVEVAPITGNIYVGGGFWGELQLDGSSVNAPTSSTFILKLDDALTAQWITAGGGNNTTYGSWLEGLAIDAAENSYITGECSGDTVTFGAHTFIGHTFYDDEVFTAKLDPNGVVQWLRRGGSEQNDEAFDIIADGQGNTVITGLLGGNIPYAEFDGIQVDIVSQSAHCFIARYDANGQIIYAERMGGGSDDVGFGLALANDSTFFLTGSTWGSSSWLNWNFVSCCADPNLFLAKLNNTFNQLSTEVREFSAGALFLLPNPAHDRVKIGGVPAGTDISIYNAHGQRMPQVLSSGMMDVSTWPSGVYHLRARTGSMVSTARLVVDH